MARHDHILLCISHTSTELNTLNTGGGLYLFHALRFTFFEYKMETESESSISGDDSVFWLDSEVLTEMTGSEEGEREDNFR